MFGVAVVLVLAGLMVPITLLLAALLVDFFVVTWALFHLWHDDWSPRIAHAGSRMLSRSRAALHFHARPKHAH